MSGISDLNSSYFFFGASDSPSDAIRRVVGPCRLHGVILYYKNLHSSSNDVKGTLQIKDGTTSSASDIKFEIPVVTLEGYGNCQTISMLDGDGYIRFDDGMYLTQTDDSGSDTIFTSFAISLVYTGGS